jgi:hypothetical protein
MTSMPDTVVNTADSPKLASLAEVRNFFGMDGKEMVSSWRKLTDQGKTDLRTGIGNGTLTY